MIFNLLSTIFDPLLIYPFLQRATMVCILSSVICALMGAMLMSGRTSFLGDALSHGMLPGIALGTKIGGPWWVVSLFGAGSGILLTTTALWSSKHHALDMNSSIAGMYLIAIALSMFWGGSEDLMHAFFGSILTVPQSYVYALMGCCVCSFIFMYYFFDDLIAYSFDVDFAQRASKSAAWIFRGWIVIFVINAAIQFQGIGALVVLGLTILPFLSFYTMGVHLRSIIWKSALWNITATLASLLLSCHQDWPYGPTLLLILGFGYGASLIYSRLTLPHLWRSIVLFSSTSFALYAQPTHIMTSSFLLKHLTEILLPKKYTVQAIAERGHLHNHPCSAKHLMKIAQTDLIILHGTGIDTHWTKLFQSSGIRNQIIILSEHLPSTLPILKISDDSFDGHVWHNPYYVMCYIRVIAHTLIVRYPECEAHIRHALKTYQKQLHALDQWIVNMWHGHHTEAGVIAHDGLIYYQKRYGITLYSVPEELHHKGQCLTKFMQYRIRAVFPEQGHGDTICRQWAKDLNAHLGNPLYIDDLPPEKTYIEIMQHNTKALYLGLTGRSIIGS